MEGYFQSTNLLENFVITTFNVVNATLKSRILTFDILMSSYKGFVSKYNTKRKREKKMQVGIKNCFLSCLVFLPIE